MSGVQFELKQLMLLIRIQPPRKLAGFGLRKARKETSAEGTSSFDRKIISPCEGASTMQSFFLPNFFCFVLLFFNNRD